MTNNGAGAATAPSDLQIVISSGSGSSTTHLIKPKDSSLHKKYTFFVRVEASGGSFGWFGPYSLDVGCTPSSVSFVDNPEYITSVLLNVGDDVTDTYIFKAPTASRSWCIIMKNEIVNPDGTPWTSSN